MSGGGATYRPKRHWRHELYSLALIMLAPLVVALVFPYEALSFKANAEQEKPRHSLCSFIALTEQQAEAAVQAARSAIRTSHEGMSRMRANLSISEVPEESGSVAEISERLGAQPMDYAAYDALPLPPSLAAPQPTRIIADESSAAYLTTFSRDEMLSIHDEP